MFVNVQFPIAKNLKQQHCKIRQSFGARKCFGKTRTTNRNLHHSQRKNSHFKMVANRKTFGNQVEVLSGLSANEQYIVSAEGKLYNGAKVSIQ
jgi:hypothetical protein